MNVKTISGICFFLAMLFAVLLLLDVSVAVLPRAMMAYGVIGLGVAGILLNLFTVRQSKHSIAYSIVYWFACLLSVIGIGMITMHWPYAKQVIYAGLILMAVSFFIPKKRKDDQKDDTELLDDL